MKTISILLLTIPVSLTVSTGWAQTEDDFLKAYAPEAAKRRAPEKQVKGSQGVKPLSEGILPGIQVPFSQKQERQNPPPPDRLIGKVKWGLSDDKIKEWNLEPNDCSNISQMLEQSPLGLKYAWQSVDLAEFDYSPDTLKVLFFSGVRTLRLDDQTLVRLRKYVQDGGSIFFDSLAGSKHFTDSARAIGSRIFPERQWRRLPPDHPFYHMVTDIEKIKLVRHDGDQPVHDAIYIGSRAGIILSPFGMGPGWSRRAEREDFLQGIESARFYDNQSAQELGVNLAAYIVGYAEAGVVEGRPEIYGSVDDQTPSDEFVFAQIRHGDAWNVHPGAARNMLLKLARSTSLRVNLKRRAITLGKDNLSDVPFLYLTGLDNFTFSQEQRQQLKRFIEDGGTLLINNGLGLASFHQSVEREFAAIFPDQSFQTLPVEHPIFRALPNLPARQVEYSPALQMANIDLGDKPTLEGLTVNGALRVIYSPYDMEGGWHTVDYPLFRGYSNLSAMHLGMNIITYVLTQ